MIKLQDIVMIHDLRQGLSIAAIGREAGPMARRRQPTLSLSCRKCHPGHEFFRRRAWLRSSSNSKRRSRRASGHAQHIVPVDAQDRPMSMDRRE